MPMRMLDVYEYRQTGRSQVVWLTAALVAFLLAYGVVNDASHTMSVVWAAAGVVLMWMLMRAPVRGIRVDDEHLTLNAWHKPRTIALADVSHLRATHWTDDANITVVYKDGTEESTNARDMPDLNTLALVLAERGIKIKDPGLMV